MALDVLDRFTKSIPPWLAWPLSAASTICALTGAGLVFAAAAFGSVAAAIWAALVFAVAGAFWYAADFATINRDNQPT